MIKIEKSTFMNNIELLGLLAKHGLDSSVRIHTMIPHHKPGKLLFLSDYCLVINVTMDEETPIGIDPKQYVLIVLFKTPGIFIEISLNSAGERFSLDELVKELRDPEDKKILAVQRFLHELLDLPHFKKAQ